MTLEETINQFFPPQVDLRAVAAESLTVTTDHRKVLAFCDRLRDEAIAWQDELRLIERTERAYDFLAGHQVIPRQEKDYRARTMINLFHSVIERKAGMLTDQVLDGEVVSLSGMHAAAHVLGQVRAATWEERDGQEMLMTAIVQASLSGAAPVCVLWDRQLDFGLGDIRMDVLPPGSVFVDRRLRRAAALQDNAQYLIVETPMPLAEIYMKWPDTGFLVKPDNDLSTYHTRKKPGGMTMGYGQYRRPSRREQPFSSSAIPYAMVKRLYFRDHTVDPVHPKKADGSLNYLFPRKRVITWANGVVLYDGDPANWDGLFPIELLDWGVETQHPYGESEVDNLASVQSAINVLISGVVNNAILINDPPFIVDEDAFDAEDLQELRKWGDRPGWVNVKKQGTTVDRWPPGSMSPVVFQTLQFLLSGMEMSSGITPVTRGEQPGSNITSGVAIDSLMQSAQITIRRQGRAVRNFLKRIGQLQINRIIQYFPDNRILHLTDNKGETIEVLWNRAQFFESLGQAETEEEMDEKIAEVFRDMRFRVRMEPSMTTTQMQQAQIVTQQVKEGRLADVEALKAFPFIENPEEKLDAARQEQMLKGQVQAAMAQQQAVNGAVVKAATEPPKAPPPQGGA